MPDEIVFIHRLVLAIRLLDTTSGRNINADSIELLADGKIITYSQRDVGMLIIQSVPKDTFTLEIRSPFYESYFTPITPEVLAEKMPLLDIHLIPVPAKHPTLEFYSIEGNLDGITKLGAVRTGNSACQMREVDKLKQTMTISNPHKLALDRTYYALVDLEQGVLAPFKILNKINESTVKILQVPKLTFRDFTPISPIVFGSVTDSGSYVLRVLNDGFSSKWLVYYEIDSTLHFQFVDFKENDQPQLLKPTNIQIKEV